MKTNHSQRSLHTHFSCSSDQWYFLNFSVTLVPDKYYEVISVSVLLKLLHKRSVPFQSSHFGLREEPGPLLQNNFQQWMLQRRLVLRALRSPLHSPPFTLLFHSTSFCNPLPFSDVQIPYWILQSALRSSRHFKGQRKGHENTERF